MRNLSTVIVATRHYDDSKAKELLWCAYMSYLSDSFGYYHVKRQQYISDDIVTWRTEHGIAITTSDGVHMNVNMIIPMRSNGTSTLMDEVSDLRTTLWKRRIVNMMPVLSFFDLTISNPDLSDRVIPSRRHICNVTLSDDHSEIVCLGASIKVTEILSDARLLTERNARPLTRMTELDSCDALYWHRFSCGTIALFTNGVRSLLPQSIHESCTELSFGELSPFPRFVTTQIVQPTSFEDAVSVIADRDVPAEIRGLVVITVAIRFGISDRLLQIVVQHFNLEHSHDSIVATFIAAHFIVTDESSPSFRCLRTILDLVAVQPDQYKEAWHTWLFQSKLIYRLVARISTAELRNISILHDVVLILTTLFLVDRDAWDTHDVQKAIYLYNLNPTCESIVVTSAMTSLCDRVTTLQRTADDAFSALIEPQETTRVAESTVDDACETQSKQAPLMPAPLGDEDATCQVVVCRTHHDVARRLTDITGYECCLIGSGVYCDVSDADVVFLVPDVESLSDAYDAVLRVLPRESKGGSWIPQFDHVSNDHVSVIRGRFCGLDVDVQVWRGSPSTPAEAMTFQALELTRELSCGMSDEQRRNVVELHRCAAALSLKCHRLCRLPGIAITCIALVLGGSTSVTSTSLLERLRDAVACEFPSVNFDGGGSQRVCRDRPLSPMTVFVREVNVATRLTLCTTRHMLDTLSYVVERAVPLTHQEYSLWRSRTMICAVTVIPSNGVETVYRMLHNAIAALDGHPCIESVMIDDGSVASTTSLCVYVTITSSVRRYAFRPDDVVTPCDEESVTVTRGQRSWRLCAIHRSRTSLVFFPWDTMDKAWWVLESSGCVVPNVPTLSLDVAACFDVRHWTVRVGAA